MKSYAKRILALVLCVLTFASLFVMSADAAKVSSASIESNVYGKNVMIFYANTNNGKKGTVKVLASNSAGMLTDEDGNWHSKNGYWEVKIYGRNSTSESWTYIKKVNISGSNSKVLSMSGYSQYKIRVYAWNTATIGTYLGDPYSSNAFWDYYRPECKFTAYKNCYLAK